MKSQLPSSPNAPSSPHPAPSPAANPQFTPAQITRDHDSQKLQSFSPPRSSHLRPPTSPSPRPRTSIARSTSAPSLHQSPRLSLLQPNAHRRRHASPTSRPQPPALQIRQSPSHDARTRRDCQLAVPHPMTSLRKSHPATVYIEHQLGLPGRHTRRAEWCPATCVLLPAVSLVNPSLGR